VSGRTLGRVPPRTTAPPVLRLADHGRAATVDLEHEELAVVRGDSGLFEEGSGAIAERVYHAQGRARAWSPLMRLRERVARARERQLRAQPAHGEHDAEAEATREAEFAVDREVTSRSRPPHASSHGSTEGHLTKERAQGTAPFSVDPVGPACMQVVGGAGTLPLPLQEQEHQGAPKS
jgi:hypothetical protein